MSEKDRLTDEAIANKRRYDGEYLKENYKQIHFHIRKEEAEEFQKLLKQLKISNNDFIRLCIKLLKQGKIKKED